MSRRAWIVVAGVVVVALALGGPLIAIETDHSKPQQQTPSLDLASSASSRFLNDYVNPNGQVRTDNTEETQGQAQSWGLLIAAANGDSEHFANILKWFDANVSASDHTAEVDLDSAWALEIAGSRFGNVAYTDAAKTAAQKAFANHPSLLSNSQVVDGVFFRGEQQLAGLDPSMPVATSIQNQRAALQKQLGAPHYSSLPVASGAQVAGQPVYANAAQSVPLNLQSSCDVSDKKPNTWIWTKLRVSRDTRTARALSASGKVVDNTQSVRAAVASSAASSSAGEGLQSLNLLVDADGIQQQHPSTQGAAWDALGRILITTPWLGSC